MLKTFSMMREQVHHDFDLSRAIAWLKTEEAKGAELLTAVTHGVFNLTLLFKIKAKEELTKTEEIL